MPLLPKMGSDGKRKENTMKKLIALFLCLCLMAGIDIIEKKHYFLFRESDPFCMVRE
jgi:hypothetical protein